MIHHFSNSASPFLPATATESSSSSSRPCMDAEMLNIGEYLLVDDLLEFSNDDIAGPIESSTTAAAALLEFPAMPSYDSSILLPSTVGRDVCSLTSSEGPEMDWLSSLHDEVEEEEDEQRIGSGVFKIGAKLSGRQFPASYTFNNNNNNNNIISKDAWCVPALTQIVRAGSAGKAARSKRSRSSNYAGGWTGCSNNSGLLINSSESVADSRGSLDSDLLTDLSSTSNTFCQSEIINVIRPIVPFHSPASNCLPPSADRHKSSKKGRENKVDDSGRKCTHCQSQKTPQWRLGPAGPKTLCNACGVRFKSGRLFPEYRPAKSPTFISHRHSNSHRKVLEMRKHKGLLPLVGIASSPARFKTGSISMESSWTIQNSNMKLHKRKLASASSSDSSSAVVFQDDGHDDEYKNDADYNEEDDEEEDDDDDNDDEEEEEEEETC